jgi:hypothetical protein
MFDLRYHVASLAAVFLALILGIVIGAAISDPTLADATENDRLRHDLSAANARADASDERARESEAAQTYAGASYDALVHDRLAGKRVLLVSVGPLDERLEHAATAVRDAGGWVGRTRALQVPAGVDAIDAAIKDDRDLAKYMGAEHLRDVGRDFARELANGGSDTPLLDALSDVLVQQRQVRGAAERVDAVVVARSAGPQMGPMARFVSGLYEGFAGGGQPAVGIDLSSADASGVRAFGRADLPTVSDVDLVPGKVALAVLLAGGPKGRYGLNKGEEVVPEIEPVSPEPPPGG